MRDYPALLNQGCFHPVRGIDRELTSGYTSVKSIIPVVAGGQTTDENLALACVSCSLRKEARQLVKNLELSN